MINVILRVWFNLTQDRPLAAHDNRARKKKTIFKWGSFAFVRETVNRRETVRLDSVGLDDGAEIQEIEDTTPYIGPEETREEIG